MGRFFRSIVEGAKQYIEYIAWLSAVPEGRKESRYEALKGSIFSEINCDISCAWLVEEAKECGLASTNEFSAIPVSWMEIQAWMQSTERKGIWIAQTVKWLSMAYVNKLRDAKDPNCPIPIPIPDDDETLQTQRRLVANQVKAIIARMKSQ